MMGNTIVNTSIREFTFFNEDFIGFLLIVGELISELPKINNDLHNNHYTTIIT